MDARLLTSKAECGAPGGTTLAFHTRDFNMYDQYALQFFLEIAVQIEKANFSPKRRFSRLLQQVVLWRDCANVRAFMAGDLHPADKPRYPPRNRNFGNSVAELCIVSAPELFDIACFARLSAWSLGVLLLPNRPYKYENCLILTPVFS